MGALCLLTELMTRSQLSPFLRLIMIRVTTIPEAILRTTVLRMSRLTRSPRAVQHSLLLPMILK